MINIAEILRECPRGMELDCPCFENVRFDHVDAKDRIRCLCGPTDDEVSFTAYGTLNYSPMAKVVLFPKGKESWEKVEQKKFKKGDIVYIRSNSEWVAIYNEIDDRYLYEIVALRTNGELVTYSSIALCSVENIKEIRFATDEERNKLLDAIQRHGYQWNAETKTLEYLVPKFDLATIKPFDKVLVRDSDKDMWCASIFSHTWKDKYFCVGAWHNQCIPYEGNEHLLGTTDDCDDKTWEDRK